MDVTNRQMQKKMMDCAWMHVYGLTTLGCRLCYENDDADGWMRNIDRWKRRTSENQKSKRWMLGLHG